MDHSPGEDEGEIDHLSRDAAIEYLLMPERVKKLEGQVEALANSLEELLNMFRPKGHVTETMPRDARSKNLSYVA